MSGGTVGGGGTDEQMVVAAIQRTDLLAYQNRENDALALLAEALATSPDDPRLLTQRAWLQNRLDLAPAALESARAALRIDPGHMPALFQMSNAYLRQHEDTKAEQTLVHMLGMWPDEPVIHRALAIALAAPVDRVRKRSMRRTERQRRRDLAYAHFQRSLEIAPDDPDGHETAARVVSVFSKDQAQALLHADQGLALAPEHLGLLQIRSVIVEEATATAKKGGGARASHMVAVVEADRILRLDPGNAPARNRLFAVFWAYRVSLVDAPLIGLALILFSVCIMFVNDQVLLFFPGLILAASSTAVRVARYFRLASKVNPALKRSVIFGTPHAGLRIVLGSISWAAMLLAGVALPFVRDAVLLRWMIVALGAAVIVALIASLLWHTSYAAASQRSGGATKSSASLGYARTYRRQLLMSVVLRGVLAAVAIGMLAGTGFRADARSIASMAFAALLLPPLAGMIMAGIAERRRVAALPADSTVRRAHRVPGVARLVITGVVAVVAAATVALNLMSLPILPNQYDAIGRYRLAPQIRDSEPSAPGIDLDPVVPTYEPLDLPTITVPPVVVPSP